MSQANDQDVYTKGRLLVSLIRGLHATLEEDIRTRLQTIHGLNYPAFRLLWILFFEEKMSMTELTNIALTNISNTYRQLIKLAEKDLVLIDTGEDARMKEIRLTDTGREIIKKILMEYTTDSDLNLLPVLLKIPDQDIEKFFEVAAFLCRELVGEEFTDWALKTTDSIQKFRKKLS